MFTGIIQSVATLTEVNDNDGIRTFLIQFETGFCNDLQIGASVSVDGVCLTVTELISNTMVKFDVMLQSLKITTLSEYPMGTRVNVERAAKDGAEIGGHPLSGHVDFKTPILSINQIENNYSIRFELTGDWKRYLFSKGYVALNGTSLTLSEVNKAEGWFEVWLIPETRRMTTFEQKAVGDNINVEIERGTQVLVDTIRDAVQENLGRLYPIIEKLAREQGMDLDELADVAPKISQDMTQL